MGLLKIFHKFKNSSIVILTDFAVRSILAKLYSQVIKSRSVLWIQRVKIWFTVGMGTLKIV